MPGGPVTSVCQQQPVQRRGSMCPRLRAECRLQDRGSALRGPSPGPATRSALVDVAAWCTDLVERLRRSDDDDGLHAVRLRQLRDWCVPRDGSGHPSRWDLRPAAVLARDALGLQVRQQGRGAERDPQGGRRTRSGEHQAQGTRPRPALANAPAAKRSEGRGCAPEQRGGVLGGGLLDGSAERCDGVSGEIAIAECLTVCGFSRPLRRGFQTR